jgi:hypothetical protein
VQQNLDRDVAVHSELACPVDGAHAAGAHLALHDEAVGDGPANQRILADDGAILIERPLNALGQVVAGLVTARRVMPARGAVVRRNERRVGVAHRPGLLLHRGGEVVLPRG